MSMPKLTDEQRQAALEKAKAARQARAAVLNDVRAEKLSVSKVIEMADTDDAISRIRVENLIRAVPGYGKARAEKAMNEIGIASSRRVRGLGSNQREALAKMFG